LYLNEVTLIGNLGADAEGKTTTNNNEHVVLSLAVNRSWKSKETGEYETRTDWVRVAVWGSLVKFAKTLKKGERILVKGELRTREYEKAVGNGRNKKDVTMYVTEVRALKLQRMDRKSKDAADDEAASEEFEEVPE
jgi:single-strand DNA-binding protein